MMRVRFFAVLVGLAVIAPSMAAAACPSDQQVAAMAQAFLNKEAGDGYGKGLTPEEGYCAQAKYLALLEKHLGAHAGYKVGFTGKESQERFGVTEPARGVLFQSMLLESGATLNAKFGARPFYEADLIVTVKDEGINDARTPLEVAQHLDQVVPFIELPDIIVAKGRPLDGPGIIAINVAARFGVIGKGIPVQPTEAFVEAIAAMEVVMVDDRGTELKRVKGAALMGNPLNVVVWLVQHLKQYGLKLRAGDYLSLGTLTGLAPPESGRTITVRYLGLPGGDSQASVSFD